jgi:hypothetical protein
MPLRFGDIRQAIYCPSALSSSRTPGYNSISNERGREEEAIVIDAGSEPRHTTQNRSHRVFRDFQDLQPSCVQHGLTLQRKPIIGRHLLKRPVCTPLGPINSFAVLREISLCYGGLGRQKMLVSYRKVQLASLRSNSCCH